MEKLEWIKDLVKTEQQMEESGIVDMSSGIDAERLLITESIQYLLAVKTEFIDASTHFNELKPSTLGRIKIYGIAKTHADFMLFRNGFKLIFSLSGPGVVTIKFNFIGNSMIPSPGSALESTSSVSRDVMGENTLEARWGAFGEIFWTFQGQVIKIPYLVRHYMSLFIRESAK